MDGSSYNELPSDIQSLKSLVTEHNHTISQQQNEIHFLKTEVAKLQEEKRLDRARRFGASSEAGDHQARLFDEAETHQDEVVEDDRITVPAHSKRRPRRKPLPKDLPRVIVRHELEDTACGCCGKAMQVIGEATSEQLDVIPAQVFVREHHRLTYSCARCDESIITAPMPAQPIPKSIASPGLLAHVAVAKYADGLPLYRQSKQFARLNIELPRNTLASHMVKLGQLVTPLINVLHQHVLSYDCLAMDETPVQVLKEDNKPAQSKSYMWVMKGGPPDQPGILYHYAPTRAQTVPETLLKDYGGYLQTDGYAGYNAVLKKDTITGLGCWAHARRKFKDAEKALPTNQRNKGNKVQLALAFIAKLYRLETEIKALAVDAKASRRQEVAKPILKRFKTWLDNQSVPPKTLLGIAIGYTLNEWSRLIVYTRDGRLNIDNNLIENTIRPFAIGRKNWLFSHSTQGAEASANLYSLIETAKANGINEYAYLKLLFTELPSAKTQEQLYNLLPWNLNPKQINDQLIKPS